MKRSEVCDESLLLSILQPNWIGKRFKMLDNNIIIIDNKLYHSFSILINIVEAIFQNKSIDMSGGLKATLTCDRRLKK